MTGISVFSFLNIGSFDGSWDQSKNHKKAQDFGKSQNSYPKYNIFFLLECYKMQQIYSLVFITPGNNCLAYSNWHPISWFQLQNRSVSPWNMKESALYEGAVGIERKRIPFLSLLMGIFVCFYFCIKFTVVWSNTQYFTIRDWRQEWQISP